MGSIDNYSMENNEQKAKEIFNFILDFPKYYLEGMDWDWRKKRTLRTKYVFSLLSFAINAYYNEYTYLNPQYLVDILQNWQIWLDTLDNKEGMLKKINFYQKMIDEGLTHELGEILVDLSSSPTYPPSYLTFAIEYENVPEWQRIIYDFRKLLHISARIKIGLFHLPAHGKTQKAFSFDDEGNMKNVNKFLKWRELLEILITDIKNEINYNIFESKSTIYLIIFIRNVHEKNEPDIYGYLINREKLDSVSLTILNSPEKQV